MKVSKFDERYKSNEFIDKSSLNDLKTIKNNTLLDIKVASIGKVVSISDDMNSIKVDLLPHFNYSSNRIIECVNNVRDIQSNDFVIVLFMDYNFLANIRQIRNNANLTVLDNVSEIHSEKFGIVISKINIFEKEEGEK